ncbi:hypothetical protein PIB30_084528 [Stylosanthes scabra]|uniref:Uncharacterized protein n=1 Tax=Stylosanthes scabra TaxID=79078 RepID=A0ABU6TS23_9FABA|nr:hypothetical protein [Stylosanthes scabra]
MRTSCGLVCFKDDLFWREGVHKKTRYGSAFGRTLVYHFGSPRNGGGVDLQGHSDAQPGMSSSWAWCIPADLLGSCKPIYSGPSYSGPDHSLQAWPGVKLMVNKQVEL